MSNVISQFDAALYERRDAEVTSEISGGVDFMRLLLEDNPIVSKWLAIFESVGRDGWLPRTALWRDRFAPESRSLIAGTVIFRQFAGYERILVPLLTYDSAAAPSGNPAQKASIFFPIILRMLAEGYRAS
jgi:hypothetical protein